MINNVLLVCTGNICRSPMAAELFRERFKKSNPTLQVDSAGLHAVVNAPAVAAAQDVMQNFGMSIAEHRAKKLDEGLVSRADLILVMEREQKREIGFIFPYAYGRVHLLFASGIPDPFGSIIDVFYDTFSLIEKGFDEWQKRIV